MSAKPINQPYCSYQQSCVPMALWILYEGRLSYREACQKINQHGARYDRVPEWIIPRVLSDDWEIISEYDAAYLPQPLDPWVRRRDGVWFAVVQRRSNYGRESHAMIINRKKAHDSFSLHGEDGFNYDGSARVLRAWRVRPRLALARPTTRSSAEQSPA